MYIFTRYVTWEVLKFFLAALFALTLVITLVMGIQEGLRNGLPAMVIMRTLPLLLPEMLGITLPVSMLFAVSSVFGRMTGTNEIVALKSLGISPMAVVWPVIILAGFLSLGTVYMYEIAATWCKPAVKRVAMESGEEIVYSLLHTQHSCSFPLNDPVFSILVTRVDGRTLVEPTITLPARGNQPKVVLKAESAELKTDLKRRQLTLACVDTEVDFGDHTAFHRGTMEQSIPFPSLHTDPYHRDWVSMREIPERIAEIQSRLPRLKSLRNAKKTLGQPVDAEDTEIGNWERKIYRLQAERYRRWSNGFTCLFFVLIGTPVAILLRHADVLTNFCICFLPILAVYYPLLMLSEKLATSGEWPPASFWLGNIMLCIVGVVLLRKVIKH